jgi:hypothetical protein
VKKYVSELAEHVTVALCSGNHDNTGRQVSPDRAPVYKWFIDLGTHRNVISDGATKKLENLIVTTIPYHCSKEQKSVWLDRGFALRRQTGIPWLVLHHVPPKTGSDITGEESEAGEHLAAYRPDYFVSGHDHELPYLVGSSWKLKVGDSTLFAPGQLLRAAFPNHIIFNSQTGESSWNTASATWVREDGLLDHFVLKFPRKP